MNENNVLDLVNNEEISESNSESIEIHPNDGKNVDESNILNNNSNGDLSNDNQTNTYLETYFDAELGAYPVYIVDDLTLHQDEVSNYAVNNDYYTTLNTTWIDYFAGVLANMGDTDYIAYSLRDYDSGDSSYTEHYVLVLNVDVENDSLVAGNYNCMDIYRDSNSKSYICNEHTVNITSVPFPAYGSFGNLSDIRKGVSHNETWAILFAIGFAVVYSVCHDIFDYVMSLSKNR